MRAIEWYIDLLFFVCYGIDLENNIHYKINSNIYKNKKNISHKKNPKETDR